MDNKYLFDVYKLVVNPFKKDMSAQEDHLRMWSDRKKQMKMWESILENSIKYDRNSISLIIGSYGRGKTLSLFKINEMFEKRKDILKVLFNFRAEQTKIKAGLDFILRIFKSIDFNMIRDRFKPKILSDALNELEYLKEPQNILTWILLGDIAKRNQKKPLKQLTLDPDHTFTLPKSSSAEKLSLLAYYFLTGEYNPSKTEMSKLGIVRKIDNSDIAKEYLAAILHLLKLLKFNALVVTVDEFEHLFGMVSKSQQTIYIALLRSLYDFPVGLGLTNDSIARMVFYIALSEDGWARLQEMEDREKAVGGPVVPLLERIRPDITILDDFDFDKAKELIEFRLKYNRVKKKFEDDPLIPFTNDFVTYILEVTRGVPRFILVSSGHVLDDGISKKIPLITAKFAKKVLEERGFPFFLRSQNS